MEQHLSHEDPYALGRNFLASARLNLQHFIWRETCGFNVHPNIPLDKPDLAVAEVGTWTGIWLLEVAKKLLPIAQLSGFDISTDQFPAAAWLPANVTLSALDASKPPPQDIRGRFDVVHLRLFTIVIENDDPAPYIEHCRMLLKPGGCLQWDEYDPSSTGIVRVTEQASAENTKGMVASMHANKPNGWITNLPNWFARQGLAVDAVARFNTPEYLLKPFTEMICVAYMEHAELLKAKGKFEDETRIRAFIESVVGEAKNGVYMDFSFQVVVGRKAETDSVRFWTRP